jgi:ribosomal protein S18 acetylase RimI-like enzyme
VADFVLRIATPTDIPAMAEIRAGDWGTEDYWRKRIEQYLDCNLHPREALQERVAFVCLQGERMVGLVAGHRTRRFGCHGELQWISVLPEFRRQGAASKLFRLMADWFVEHDARRICVDVEPSNETARRFYKRNGADDLKPSWMVWKDIGQSRLELSPRAEA